MSTDVEAKKDCVQGLPRLVAYPHDVAVLDGMACVQSTLRHLPDSIRFSTAGGPFTYEQFEQIVRELEVGA